MERYQLALQYHARGFNCAQSVLASFSDVTGLPEQASLAVSGGMGGGVGGTRKELCGAVSGGVMALSLLYPHTAVRDKEAKQRIYDLTAEYQRRFQETFDHLRCGDLLTANYPITEKMKAASAMGYDAPACNVLIVTAVELAEQMLREGGKL